jgi:hypothetical protein
MMPVRGTWPPLILLQCTKCWIGPSVRRSERRRWSHSRQKSLNLLGASAV